MNTIRQILRMPPALAMLLPVLAMLMAGCGKREEPNARDLTREGWSRFEARDYSGAEQSFLRALGLDASYGDAYNGLGWSRLRLGSYPAALEAFDAALSREASAVDPRVGRAIIESDVEPSDVNAAIEDALAALAASPEYRFAHDPTVDWRDIRLLLARAYFALARYGSADEQVGLLGGKQQGSAVTDGLTAYWSFDTGFAATSGGAVYDCVVYNGVSLSAAGRFGAAASFQRQRGQFLLVGSRVIVQGRDHSFSAWYRLAASGIEGGAPYFVLQTTGSSPYAAAEAACYRLSKDVGIDVGLVSTRMHDDRMASIMFPEACGTNWHNIIVTYDADNVGAEHSIYLDGRGVATLASSGLLKDTAGLMLGGHPAVVGSNWDGLIDDVAFWSRVLTASEIAAIQGGAIGGLEVPVSSPTFIRDLLAEIERLQELYGS